MKNLWYLTPMWFGVSATASGQTRNVSYTYDEGDRIKSIKHGGTTYAFEYDGFGNQTMVKAGDKTLESYRYAPNNGPLKTVTYGNGDTQEILYDKEERICARRWNGESTDDVRMSMMTTAHWKKKLIW